MDARIHIHPRRTLHHLPLLPMLPPPSRLKTGSLKWQKYEGRDILPLWVADMDFPSAPEIIEALRARVDHGVFGYTVPYEEAIAAVLGYFERRHHLAVTRDQLLWLPGLVQGLNLICRAAGRPGDAVMVNTPVYPPFLSAPVFSDRRRIAVPLRADATGRPTFDFAAMEAAVTPDTRLFILCNPHNPVGTVFRRDELEQLLEFCERHDLWVCADEIHCDLILDDVPHVPFLSLGERAARRTVAFYSASKTWNLPGLACAQVIIPNPEIRAAFQRVCRGIITEVNCFGYVGATAAYNHGEPWRQELLRVLRANRDRLVRFLRAELPRVGMCPMAATYLAWLDFRSYRLPSPHAFFEQHGLGLSNGIDFGAEEGFLRLNFGCSADLLDQALQRMKAALATRD